METKTLPDRIRGFISGQPMEHHGKGCTVKVIADSISHTGVRITTLQLRYWRAIHAEFMTHRAFSRNASSSRAIPVAKMIEQVRNWPAGPIYWGRNQAGMQAGVEVDDVHEAASRWHTAAMDAAMHAERLALMGLHKQVANRLLEPFQFIEVVVTATDWDNFFELRCHPDAQPEIQDLAMTMQQAMACSVPVSRKTHMPYVTDEELQQHGSYKAACLSAARCARVSYLKHDGTAPSVDDDLALFKRLVGSKPLHASPTEHQAWAEQRPYYRCRNFTGWRQFRVEVEESAK